MLSKTDQEKNKENKENKELPIVNSAAADRAPATTTSATDNKHYAVASVVGKTVFIKGDLVGREDVFINGRIQGSVVVQQSKIEVGVCGSVDANLFGEIVIVNGTVRGDVNASCQVMIKNSGRIYGNVYSPDVAMEDGAILKGSIDMEKQISPKPETPAEQETHKEALFGSIFKRVQEMTHTNNPQEINSSFEGTDIVNVSKIPQETHPAIIAPVPQKHTPIRVDNYPRMENEDEMSTHLGETLMVRGEIIAEEDVFIGGQVEGIIYFKSNSLEIGPNANIKANIFVKSLTSYGQLNGDICASEQVFIRKPGHVYGKVCSPRVHIESGAVVKGNIEMEEQNIQKLFTSMDVKVPSTKANAPNAKIAMESHPSAMVSEKAIKEDVTEQRKKSPEVEGKKSESVGYTKIYK